MRLKRIVGLAAAMILLATAASANHANSTPTFEVTDPSPGANSNTTSSTEYGTDHPANGTVHVEGIQIAHEDGNDNVGGANDEPNDGDVVAEIKATADFKPFCFTSTFTVDGEWKSPMDSGGPSGAVAQIEFTDPLGQVIDAWVVEASGTHGTVTGDHYDIVNTDMGDSACSGDPLTVDATTFGTVSGTSRKVSENPGAGTYDVYAEYEDKATPPNTHDGSDTYSIS